MDDSQSLHRKWLFHQTSIYKWLFGVPGKLRPPMGVNESFCIAGIFWEVVNFFLPGYWGSWGFLGKKKTNIKESKKSFSSKNQSKVQEIIQSHHFLVSFVAWWRSEVSSSHLIFDPRGNEWQFCKNCRRNIQPPSICRAGARTKSHVTCGKKKTPSHWPRKFQRWFFGVKLGFCEDKENHSAWVWNLYKVGRKNTCKYIGGP